MGERQMRMKQDLLCIFFILLYVLLYLKQYGLFSPLCNMSKSQLQLWNLYPQPGSMHSPSQGHVSFVAELRE